MYSGKTQKCPRINLSMFIAMHKVKQGQCVNFCFFGGGVS